MNNFQNHTMVFFFSSNQDFQISNVDLHNLTWFQGHSFAIFLQLRNISQANGLMSIKFLHNLTSMLLHVKKWHIAQWIESSFNGSMYHKVRCFVKRNFVSYAYVLYMLYAQYWKLEHGTRYPWLFVSTINGSGLGV